MENIGVQKATWAAAGGKEACPDVLEGEDQDEDHDKDEEDEEEEQQRSSGEERRWELEHECRGADDDYGDNDEDEGGRVGG